MMTLGFVSAILPDLSLEEVLGFAASEDFACVELMCGPMGKAERRYAGVTHIDVVGKEDADQVRAQVAAAGVAFSQDEWPGGKNLASSPAIWRRMFEEIPGDNFGLNYDPSHMIWQHMDYLKPIREFADRLYHVHAKDVRLDQHRLDDVGVMATPLEYHVPKLPGLGDVDWGQFFSVLSDVGYEGPVCIEVEDRAYEATLESRQTSLVQSGRYLRQFMP